MTGSPLSLFYDPPLYTVLLGELPIFQGCFPHPNLDSLSLPRVLALASQTGAALLPPDLLGEVRGP